VNNEVHIDICGTQTTKISVQKMAFILALTMGGASNLSCQSIYQVHLVYSSMSSSIVTQSKFSSVIRCGITKKVAMEWYPWSFHFMPVPFVALRFYVVLPYVCSKLF
jgi:hypothetical protein